MKSKQTLDGWMENPWKHPIFWKCGVFVSQLESIAVGTEHHYVFTTYKSEEVSHKNTSQIYEVASLSTERSSKPEDLPVVCKHQPVFNNNKTLRSPTKHVGDVQQYATIRGIVHLQHIYNNIFLYDQDLKSVL